MSGFVTKSQALILQCWAEMRRMTRRAALALMTAGVWASGRVMAPTGQRREPEPAPDAPQTHSVVVTAYCGCESCCGRWADGLTATGTTPRHNRTVAADWKVFPPNTRLRLPGVGIVTVEDSGSAIRGHRLDLYHETHEAALAWGRRRMVVTILAGSPMPTQG